MVSNKAMSKFKCQRCGWCCKNKRIIITYSDVKRWKQEGRWDILAEVSLIDYRNHKDPKIRKTTGFYFEKTCRPIPNRPACPFLGYESGKSKCLIYDTRPKACKNNPEIIPKENFKDWLGCPAFRKKWSDEIWTKES